jgi:hypothetical protein
VLSKNRMASGVLTQDEKRLLKHALLVLVPTKRAVICWQCFSDLGLTLIIYLGRSNYDCLITVGTGFHCLSISSHLRLHLACYIFVAVAH